MIVQIQHRVLACMCACVCVRVCVCMCVCECVCVIVCVRLRLRACVCMSVSVSALVCAYIRSRKYRVPSFFLSLSLSLPLAPLPVCLFVWWVNKPRAVKPLRRFHSRRLSFTQDGPAFSTKTARRALQFQLRSALSKSWRAGLSRSTIHTDLTKHAKPNTRRILSHPIGPPDSTYRPAPTLNLRRV